LRRKDEKEICILVVCDFAFTVFPLLKPPGQPIDAGELTEKEIIRAERNSGVISNRVREIQVIYHMAYIL